MKWNKPGIQKKKKKGQKFLAYTKACKATF